MTLEQRDRAGHQTARQATELIDEQSWSSCWARSIALIAVRLVDAVSLRGSCPTGHSLLSSLSGVARFTHLLTQVPLEAEQIHIVIVPALS
jgi:hypothetical protein